MLKYVESSLSKGESVIYSARVSQWLIYGLTLQVAALLGALIFIKQYAFMHQGMSFSLGGFDINLTLYRMIATGLFLYLLKKTFWLLVYIFTTEIAITTRRVIYKTGLVFRYTWEIRTDRIEGSNVGQGVIARLLNFGSVYVTGMGNNVLRIHDIDDPIGFRRALLDQLPSGDDT